MLKKYLQKILLLFITLGVTSLQATQGSPGTGKYSDDDYSIISDDDYCIITDDKYKLGNLPLNNSLDRAYLEGEKGNFRDNNITKTIKDKKGVHFFMMIASNNKTKGLNKFFFFNRAPGQEPDAIRKVSEFYKCHVISHTTAILSPHIIFQVLGWMEQNSRKYTPTFIHASSPVCITCHSIALNLFNLNIPTNDKGCWGNSNIELENQCPLAQKYIKSHLTLDLAKRILLPKVENKYKEKINQMVAENDKKIEKFSNQIKLLKTALRNGIKEVNYSPLKGYENSFWSVAISHDNKYIVSGSSNTDKTIRIWDLKTGKEVGYSPLYGHTNAVERVAITSDNKYIVSSSFDKTIRIWNFNTGKEVSYSPLKGHTHYVWSVAISHDNKYIVSGSEDNTLRIWDFKTGKEVNYSPLEGHTSSVYSVAVSQDNQYIVSGSYRTIRIWDFKTGKEVDYSPLRGHTSSVKSVAISSDNKYIVSGSEDETIRIWDLKTGKELDHSPLTAHTKYVLSVAISSDNKYIVSGSRDKTIRIWHIETGALLLYTPLKGHTSTVWSVAISQDNQYIVSGSEDKTLRIWDIKLLKYLNEDDYKQEEVLDID